MSQMFALKNLAMNKTDGVSCFKSKCFMLLTVLIVFGLGLGACTNKKRNKKTPAVQADKSKSKINPAKTDPKKLAAKKKLELKKVDEAAIKTKCKSGTKNCKKNDKVKVNEEVSKTDCPKESGVATGKCGKQALKTLVKPLNQLKISKKDAERVTQNEKQRVIRAEENRSKKTYDIEGKGLSQWQQDNPHFISYEKPGKPADTLLFRFIPNLHVEKEQLEIHWAKRLLERPRGVLGKGAMPFVEVGSISSPAQGTHIVLDPGYQYLNRLSAGRLRGLYEAHVCNDDYGFQDFCLIVDAKVEGRGFLLKFTKDLSTGGRTISVAKVNAVLAMDENVNSAIGRTTGERVLASQDLLELCRVTQHLDHEYPVRVYVKNDLESYYKWLGEQRLEFLDPTVRQATRPEDDPIVKDWGPAKKVEYYTDRSDKELIYLQNLKEQDLYRLSSAEKIDSGIFLATIVDGAINEKKWSAGICEADQATKATNNKVKHQPSTEWLQCYMNFDLKGFIQPFIVSQKHLKGKGRIICKNIHGDIRDAWPIKADLKSIFGLGLTLKSSGSNYLIPSPRYERHFKNTGIGIGYVEGAREFVGKEGQEITIFEADCLIFGLALSFTTGPFSSESSFGWSIAFDAELIEDGIGLGCSGHVSTLSIKTNDDEFRTRDNRPLFRSQCNPNDIVKSDYIRYLNEVVYK